MKSEYTAFDGKKFNNEGECLEYELNHYKEEFEKSKSELIKISKKIKINYDSEMIDDLDISKDAIAYRVIPTNKSELNIIKKIESDYKSYLETYCEYKSDLEYEHYYYDIYSNINVNKMKVNDSYLIILDTKKCSYTECESERECIYHTIYSYYNKICIISLEVEKKKYLAGFKDTERMFK